MYSGSLKDLQDIYAWRDELERQTLKLEDLILDILESNWLKGGKKKKKKLDLYHIKEKLIYILPHSIV